MAWIRLRTRNYLYYLFYEHAVWGNATIYTILSALLLGVVRYYAYEYVRTLYVHYECLNILNITGFVCLFLHRVMTSMSLVFQQSAYTLLASVYGGTVFGSYAVDSIINKDNRNDRWYFVYSTVGKEADNIQPSRSLIKRRSRAMPKGNKEISRGYDTYLQCSNAYREFVFGNNGRVIVEEVQGEEIILSQ